MAAWELPRRGRLAPGSGLDVGVDGVTVELHGVGGKIGAVLDDRQGVVGLGPGIALDGDDGAVGPDLGDDAHVGRGCQGTRPGSEQDSVSRGGYLARTERKTSRRTPVVDITGEGIPGDVDALLVPHPGG